MGKFSLNFIWFLTNNPTFLYLLFICLFVLKVLSWLYLCWEYFALLSETNWSERVLVISNFPTIRPNQKKTKINKSYICHAEDLLTWSFLWRYEDVNLITKSISNEAQMLMISGDQFLDLTQALKNDSYKYFQIYQTWSRGKNHQFSCA